MGKKTIILVRHGQYHRAEEGSLERLTTLGRKQARYAGKRLREEKIDRIVYSTMPRAEETANIIKKELAYRGSFVPTKLLWECTPGYPIKLRKKSGHTDAKRLAAHKRQVERAYKKFFKSSRKDSVEVLVCHGNVIRYLVCRALGVDTDNWVKMDILQCAISIVRVRTKGPHKVAVISHNDIGHIPKHLRTFL